MDAMELPQFETAFDAIFVEKFSVKGTSLFEKQIDLSEAIRKDPRTGFHKTQDITLRSSLSQIFNGERNLSNTLKKALLLVIEPRFDKKKYDFGKYERLLIKKFGEAFERRLQVKRENEPDRDYDKLIERTRTAKELLITTLEPAETHQSELADRLKDILLEKTGIIPKTNSNLSAGKYKFYLPDIMVVRDFWESLKLHVVNKHDMDFKTAIKKIKQASDLAKITTFIAPIEIAMHPYVFLDYDNENIRTSFCVSYRNRETPSVAEMSLRFTENWLKVNNEKNRKAIELKHISFNPENS